MSDSKNCYRPANYLSPKEKKAVGKKLRLHRNSAGYTMKELAEVIGVSWHTIKGWEAGNHLINFVTACEIHRKTKGMKAAYRLEMMRPDFIIFLREFKDVIDDLNI